MINYPDTYELVLQEELPDIHSQVIFFRHKKLAPGGCGAERR